MKFIRLTILLFFVTSAVHGELAEGNENKAMDSAVTGTQVSASVGGVMAFVGYEMYVEGMDTKKRGESEIAEGQKVMVSGRLRKKRGLDGIGEAQYVAQRATEDAAASGPAVMRASYKQYKISLKDKSQGEIQMQQGQIALAEGEETRLSGDMIIFGGYAIMGMSAIRMTEALEDQSKLVAAHHQTSKKSTLALPSFGTEADGFSNKGDLDPLAGLYVAGIGLKQTTLEHLANGLSFLKHKGVVFKVSTGIVQTPVGNFQAALLTGHLERLKSLGLSDHVASKVVEKVDQAELTAAKGKVESMVHIEKLLGKYGSTAGFEVKVNGESPGVLSGNLVEGEISSEILASERASGGGSGGSNGGGASGGTASGSDENIFAGMDFGMRRNLFNPVGMYKKSVERNVASDTDGALPLYGGVPIGFKHGNIFKQISNIYSKKRSDSFIAP